MKNAMAKMQSGIQTVGEQVESGFQVCVKSWLRNSVADQEFHFSNSIQD
jgi:hypothetical protein